MIEIYVHPTCTSCKKAEAFLADQGVASRRRDYFKDRFTRAELADVFDRAGVTPNEVISRRSTAYKDLDLAASPVDDDTLLDLMIEHPTLIQRPLILTEHGSNVGFNGQRIQALLDLDRG